MDLLDRVRNDMARHRMTEPGSKVVVAVSGGADSVTLLHLLYLLKDELEISLHIAHLNHMLRGEESEEDARFVAGLAQSYGLPSTVQSIDVLAYREQRRNSVETAAREVRYSFLSDVASQCGAKRVALAHQADDQAETILINFLRGSGTTGLKGIPPVRQGGYVRPLLSLRRFEIERYCAENGLKFRTDSSNMKEVHLRNRVRHRLIPLLEKEYNPALVPALLRLGELCREEDEYFETRARQAYLGALAGESEGCLTLRLADLAGVDLAVRRRVIRMAWAALAGHEGTLSFQHVEDVIRLIEGGRTGSSAILPGSVEAVRSYRFLELMREEERTGAPYYQHPLVIPGTTHIPELDRTVYAELVPFDFRPDPKKLPPNEAVLDWDKLPKQLYVRRRKAGDVFHPFGMPAGMKLKDFFIKQKIPQAQRDRLPLVGTPEAIVWVPGLRAGERWKVDHTTKRILRLKIEP
ncbi:tRNA(Ile)-lysidine synthase [Pelotomaculum sp. FP]|uniref:tRNA lysidine(34) synthetase TilS n=1 Tax=Pelotomaculum sp. FP TaxID=261474 RepID=UPI0010653702|nr:tRNA lysidine(34) synthetase TilS [Pelotomaculum sp. FP]TEB17225.1 tRNA(Ile)-lysidine synthase [Pelotomaculum sp. FP]